MLLLRAVTRVGCMRFFFFSVVTTVAADIAIACVAVTKVGCILLFFPCGLSDAFLSNVFLFGAGTDAVIGTPPSPVP